MKNPTREELDELLLRLEQEHGDSLQHYGVLGMKWGVRRKKSPEERAKIKSDRKAARKAKYNATKQMYKDQFRHPIASTVEQLKFAKKHPLRVFYMDTKSMEALNKAVAMRVKKSKKQYTRKDSDEHKKATVLKKKKLSEMSNSELRTLNERLQLERQYKDLNPSTTSSGKKFVTAVLKEVGKELAKEALKSGVKTGAKAGVAAVARRRR